MLYRLFMNALYLTVAYKVFCIMQTMYLALCFIMHAAHQALWALWYGALFYLVASALFFVVRSIIGSIKHQEMRHPVMLPCGHVFEFDTLVESKRRGYYCTSCRQ